MNTDMQLTIKYGKWFDKKTQSLPSPQKTLIRRTLNTAIQVVSCLREIEFVELSTSLYFFCQDVQTKQFTRLYEAQLELAGANEDKFIKGLHKFYQETARMIKKNGLLSLFLEFLTLCTKVRFEYIAGDKAHQANITVLNTYQSLLLQQAEYLRPAQFDFSQVLCGVTTEGEPMAMKDIYSNFDAPSVEIERAIQNGWTPKSKAELLARTITAYRKYGYTEVNSFEDIDRISNIDRIFTNHHCAMAAYINEYTYDLLPDTEHPFSTFVYPFYSLQYDMTLNAQELKEQLRHRSRTLPSNGVHIKFQPNALLQVPQLFSEIIMKEVLHGDSIVMLYKCQTAYGDLCGYYDTQDGYLFPVLMDASDKKLFERIQMLLLYLYATQVTRDGPAMLKEIPARFWYSPNDHSSCTSPESTPLSLEIFGRGGKLENTYREHRGKTGPRAGNDAYEHEERSIQGYIRKVGAGRTPSPEAVARGKALGYDLAPDETYVQPFIKSVLRLKKKDH